MSELAEYLRDAKGDRSIDEIAARAQRHGHKLARSTVAKYLRAEHGPRVSEAIAQALSAGFDVDVRRVRELAGRQPGELRPWTPTEVSASLTQDQRDALDRLIETMVKREGGSSASTDVPPKKSGGGGKPRSLSDYKRQRLDDAAQLQQDAADHPDDDPR